MKYRIPRKKKKKYYTNMKKVDKTLCGYMSAFKNGKQMEVKYWDKLKWEVRTVTPKFKEVIQIPNEA